MPYVMVPVPEEHVEEVMSFILREIGRANQLEWDTESVTELFHDVDEASRSLLAYAARAAISGDDLSEAEAARMLQLSPREVAGILREMNEQSRERNRPTLVGARLVPETLPNGRVTEKRVLWMSAEVAPLVREAERLELADVPAPLDPQK